MAGQVALPLKTFAPLCFCCCPFICASCVCMCVLGNFFYAYIFIYKNGQRALGCVSSSAKAVQKLLEFFFTLRKETDTVLIPYCFSLLPVKWYLITAAERDAHIRSSPPEQSLFITLNSFVLNFTCPDRTHLINWMSFQAPDPHTPRSVLPSSSSLFIFSRMNIPPCTRYESVGHIWGTPDSK